MIKKILGLGFIIMMGLVIYAAAQNRCNYNNQQKCKNDPLCKYGTYEDHTGCFPI